MKTLTQYLNEKLVIFPSQVDEKLVIFPSQVDEKLVVNKDYKSPYTCAPTSFDELRKIIEDRYNKLGPGTKNDPIDFNDVDVSNIDSFRNKRTSKFTFKGIFQRTKFEYIDISNWDVSNIEDMYYMFFYCINLKSVGDLSNWDVSNVKCMNYMFYDCPQLTLVGDLSKWDVSNVTGMSFMFYGCNKLKSVGDLSNWNVSKVKDMTYMFNKSGITNISKWYKE